MRPNATSEERQLISSIAIHTRYSQEGSKSSTAAARAELWQQYLRRVDPEFVLSPEERERRAIHARKADMARLALKSAQARRKRAQAARDAELWGKGAA